MSRNRALLDLQRRSRREHRARVLARQRQQKQSRNIAELERRMQIEIGLRHQLELDLHDARASSHGAPGGETRRQAVQCAALRTLIASIDIALVLTDSDRIIVNANAAAAALLREDLGRLPGRSLDAFDAAPPRHRENPAAPPAAGTDSEQLLRIPTGKAGALRCLRLASAKTDLDGLQIHLLQDVTKQVDLDRRLRHNQQRFQDFAVASADWLWETDSEHRYIWCSQRFAEHTGLPREQFYGHSRIELGQPATPDPAWDTHLQAVARREPFRNLEFRYPGPNGERWVQSSAVPYFDERGRFAGYRGSSSDITAFKMAQRSYQVIRDHLQNAISNMNEGLAIFGPDDRLIMCNERFLVPMAEIADRVEPGIDYTALISLYAGTMLPEHLDSNDRAEWLRERLTVRDRKDQFMEVERVDGTWCRVSDCRTESGGTIMVITDITELKQRQNALEEARNRAEAANRAKSDFLANVSHELRTPLNAIIGFADLVMAEADDQGAQRLSDFSKEILMSGRHLLDLINDLLDSAKVEAGKMQLQRETFPLQAVLQDVSSLVKPQREARRLGLDWQIDERAVDIAIHADRRGLRQILLNLLSNALKFSHTGGSVTIRVDARGEDLQVTISDQGIGIAPEDLDRVFDRFVQAEGPLRRSHGGTGIGLPLSRALAELHGGTLTLDSQPGRGTDAHLFLPGCLCDSTEEALPALCEETSAGCRSAVDTTATTGARVLLAEDHPVNRSLMREIFAQLGCQTVLVEDGREAVAAFVRQPFDIVFMDVQMPGIDGLEATRRIRELETEDTHTPIVAVTANVLPEHRAQCLAAGMDDHVGKPVTKQTIATALQQWFERDGISGHTDLPPEEPAPIPAATDGGESDGVVLDRTIVDELLALGGPEMLAPIVAQLGSDCASRLPQLRDALDRGDLETVREHAHGLKGALGNLGASAAARAAKAMEDAARQGVREQLERDYPRLAALCETSVSELQALTAAPATAQAGS